MQPFSKEEQNTFYNSQPTKSIGACAWITDPQGRLLIAKPTYKKGWTLIGGIIDENEPPLAAAIREIHEEIGVQLPTDRFTLAGYRYVENRNGRNEDSQIYFGVQLTEAEVKTIVLQSDELAEYAFVPYADLHDYADSPRMQAVVVAAQNADMPFYIVNETRVL